MTIELYGLPAAGKTHYANTLARTHMCERASIHTRYLLFRYAMTFWVHHPKFTFLLFMLIVLHTNSLRELYTKCVNGLGHRLARYYLQVTSDCKIVDEGMVHNIVGLPDSSLTEKEARRLLSAMPLLADKIVYVHAIDNVRRERREARGYTFTRTNDPARQEKLQEVMEHNINLIARLLPQYVQAEVTTCKT